MKIENDAQLELQDSKLSFKTIEERRTDELVIGFVSPIGSGTSATARYLAEVLKSEYGYKDVVTIKVSAIIKNAKDNLSEFLDVVVSDKKEDRITVLQDIGNALRNRFSLSYLAKKCVEQVVHHRHENDGFIGEVGSRIPKRRRVAYIIDSLKHPAEVAQLREVYGQLFLLIGVFAPDEMRENWLEAKGVVAKNLKGMMIRDEDEPFDHGQKVRKAFHLADYFIRNDSSFDDLKIKIQRLLSVVFGIGVISPTIDESAMLTAFNSASRSACLSRQVGAAIYSQSKDLLGVGWNDVPKSGGGLYGADDKEDDNRCYLWPGGFAKKPGTCHNDYQKEVIYREIVFALRKDTLLKKGVVNESVVEALKSTQIKSLIEFSRAVHAEMEAIVSVARSGQPGIQNGTMYTTAYPCHNCARHIVAAGIDRVVFIEPYPKSLATVLHDDSICGSQQKNGHLVVFTQYEGIAPGIHIQYFKANKDRKDGKGNMMTRDKLTAVPLAPAPLDGFSTFEGIVMNILEEEESIKEGQ